MNPQGGVKITSHNLRGASSDVEKENTHYQGLPEDVGPDSGKSSAAAGEPVACLLGLGDPHFGRPRLIVHDVCVDVVAEVGIPDRRQKLLRFNADKATA